MGLGIFARKLRMTRLFDESGFNFVATVLRVEQCLISQIKHEHTDGYNAIQVAYKPKRTRKLISPQLGLLNKILYNQNSFVYALNLEPKIGFGFNAFGEFRIKNPEKITLGEPLTVSSFRVGQTICVKGTCLGKGFTGNQKRHGFSRGPLTHGSKNHRLPGSIGAGSTPGRVYPGKKMAGRLSNKVLKRVKAKIVHLDEEEQVLVLRGTVPGRFNTFLKLECSNNAVI
jgi:large subunit ribosomal protein L3